MGTPAKRKGDAVAVVVLVGGIVNTCLPPRDVWLQPNRGIRRGRLTCRAGRMPVYQETILAGTKREAKFHQGQLGKHKEGNQISMEFNFSEGVWVIKFGGVQKLKTKIFKFV